MDRVIDRVFVLMQLFWHIIMQDTKEIVQSGCSRLHDLFVRKRGSSRAIVSWKERKLLLLDQRR